MATLTPGAGRLDIRFDRREAWSYPIAWTDEDGEPVNLTGYTVAWAFYPSAESGVLGTDGTATITNASGGIATIALTIGEVTTLAAASTAGRGWHRLVLTAPDDSTEVLEGETSFVWRTT